jgi:putative phosphoribosyl transferase
MMFKDRHDAGKRLADKLSSLRGDKAVVLAVPRGGVPVGYEIANRIDALFDLIIPRKLPIPWNPEAGFGAVTPDGTMVLNEELLPYIQLKPEEISTIKDRVLEEVRRRIKTYRGNRPLPDIKGKTVIVVDDGLASGYTMIAAIRALKKYGTKKVIVAVPVSPSSAIEKVRRESVDVVCLHEQPEGPFAVASYYDDFSDLSDEEVISLLEERLIILK